jgi:hypothetical protein
VKAHFVRKASTIDDLKGYEKESGSQYAIEEVVELEPEEFKAFSENLLDDHDFIAKRIDKMFMDTDKVWHCILVKARGADEGILVESEGYDYARYAAYYPGTENPKDQIKRQIIAIRDTGETNMFDTPMVQRMSYERGYFELVTFIEEYKKEYCHFILNGEF